MGDDMNARATLLILLLLGSGAAAQDQWPTKKWPKATPKDVGLDPAVLAAFDCDLVKEKLYGYVDSMTIIRHGKVAFDKTYPRDYDRIYGRLAKEGYPNSVHDLSGPYNYYSTWWHPYYRRGDLHTLQSFTKVIVSVIIGVAVTRNEFPGLDTPVMKFFDEKKVANVDDRKRQMTIRHLLTMTSGVKWEKPPERLADAGSDTDTRFEASYDWVKFAIDLPMAEEPGTRFNYASGNAQILIHIFNKAVGMDIEEYAARHLFAPLGIEQFYWKRTPAGHVDGSGGLYLRAHDLAKIGYLYLQKGMWDGKQIVSADWVKNSVKAHSDAKEKIPGLKWGYAWASLPYGEKDQHTLFGNGGFGGQALLVLPDHDAVIAYTAWNALDDQPKPNPMAVVDQFLLALNDNGQHMKVLQGCSTLMPARPACLFPGLRLWRGAGR